MHRSFCRCLNRRLNLFNGVFLCLVLIYFSSVRVNRVGLMARDIDAQLLSSQTILMPEATYTLDS